MTVQLALQDFVVYLVCLAFAYLYGISLRKKFENEHRHGDIQKRVWRLRGYFILLVTYLLIIGVLHQLHVIYGWATYPFLVIALVAYLWMKMTKNRHK